MLADPPLPREHEQRADSAQHNGRFEVAPGDQDQCQGGEPKNADRAHQTEDA